MSKRKIYWLFACVMAATVILVLIPGTPFYLLDLFGEKGNANSQTVQKWIAGLESHHASERLDAIFALGAIGPEAAEAVPALAKIMIEDPDRVARNQASLALSKMAPASAAAVHQLAKALKDKEMIIRMNAVNALIRLKSKARPAVPALIEAIKDKANRVSPGGFLCSVHVLAVIALGPASAGSKVGVPALMAALRDNPSPQMQMSAAKSLGAVGRPAAAAADLLQSLLKSEDLEIQRAAREALKRIERE